MNQHFLHIANGLDLSPPQRLVLLFLMMREDPFGSQTFKMREFIEFSGLSSSTVRLGLRALSAKHVVANLTPTRNGFSFELRHPAAIPGLPNPRASDDEPDVDLDSIDFFDRQYLSNLLARQNGRCIYSRAALSASDAQLDHIVPQAFGGSNSYRNIVVCSFAMNSAKGSKNADEFLRDCYRRGFLSVEEFEEQRDLLTFITDGTLLPPMRIE